MGINRKQYLFNQIIAADPTQNIENVFNGDLEEQYHSMVNSGLIAPNGRSGLYAGQDRAFLSPGVLVFSPQFVPSGNSCEYVGVVSIKTGTNYKITTVWTDDELGSTIISDDILSTAGIDYFDPFVVKLANNNIIVGFHASGVSGGLFFYRSTDGGRTWTQQSTLPSTASNAYSEPCIIRLRQPGTGTPTRLVCCFTDVDPNKARDTVIRTMYSDNEGVSWSTSAVVTASSGTASCAQLSDNLRAWIYEDKSANVQLVYTRKATGSPAEVWADILNNIGQPGTGWPAAVKIATASLATSTTGTPQNGVSPCVVRTRNGGYALYYTAANYGSGGNQGELHMLTGDGTKTGWSGDTTILTASGYPNGWGRATPQRFNSGRLELLYVSVPSSSSSVLRSLNLVNG